ncbi:MAG: VirD4-like conjugal transfer protein, CD1115 family [Lachnospiraceae bacterium]
MGTLIKAIKKDKTTIILLFVLVVILLYIPLYLTAVFTKTSTYILLPVSVIKDILTDPQKLKVLACMIGLEVACGLYLSLNRSDYKSKTIELIPGLSIPASAGQGQYGTARFLSEKEIDNQFASVIINKKDYRDIHLEDAGFVVGRRRTDKEEKIYYVKGDKHTLTIGGTGAGKSRNHVLETIGLIALHGDSMQITDVKGELSDYTRPFLESIGYEVKVINYSEPMYSDGYNYLQPIIDFIDQDNLPAAIDATWDLVSQLVGEAKGERLWNDGEASIIAAAIMAVVYDNRNADNKKYQNLTNVYQFLINMCKTVGNILPLSAYVESLPPEHPSKALLGVSDIAPSRTRGSFYTSAVMTLKLFTNPYISAMSSRSDFRLEDLGRKKMALFIVLPDDRTTYHSLATLMMAQSYTYLSKEAEKNGGRLPHRVIGIYDEFGNFTKLANINQMMTMSRAKGILYNLFIQSFAQLEINYEKTGSSVIQGNCDVTIYLKSNEHETRKQVSDMLGPYTVQTYSTSANSNKTSTSITSTGSSNQLAGRSLLFPDELKKIKRPYSLVITDQFNAITFSPDLSQWKFNKWFGLGDKLHNQQVRIQRRAERECHDISDKIPLWGIWDVFTERIKEKQREAAAAAKAAAMLEQQLLQEKEMLK